MIRIEEIIEKVHANHPQANLDLLRGAYIFSARHHKGQIRASGEPYLVHPLEVANILADMRLDEVSVATGLLHDVVEDTLVEPHVGQNVGDFERVHEVRLARGARLPLVVQRGEKVGPPQHVQVGLRVVLPNFFDYLLDANHKLRRLDVGGRGLVCSLRRPLPFRR